MKYRIYKNKRKTKLHIGIKKTSVAICLFCITALLFTNNEQLSHEDYANAYEHQTEQMPTQNIYPLPDSKAGFIQSNETIKSNEKDETNKESTSGLVEEDILYNEYIFGAPVPKSEAVSYEYFDDAVFIGNSHTEGITAYSVMDNATVYAAKGIMVDTIFTNRVIKTSNGQRVTIFDALASDHFSKVYILLGANELGWVYPSTFINQYGNVIDKIRELQPDAKIYVQSILPVTAKKSSDGTVYNNVNIENFNKLILEMTDEKEVYYLDVASSVSDDTGCLPDDVSKDGMHFGSKYYTKWFDYLKTHTVE